MRFEKLKIGEKFLHVEHVRDSTEVTGKLYEKKSLSSAFILAPGALVRTTDRRLFHKTYVGFGKATEVLPLAL